MSFKRLHEYSLSWTHPNRCSDTGLYQQVQPVHRAACWAVPTSLDDFTQRWKHAANHLHRLLGESPQSCKNQLKHNTEFSFVTETEICLLPSTSVLSSYSFLKVGVCVPTGEWGVAVCWGDKVNSPLESTNNLIKFKHCWYEALRFHLF